MLAHRTKGNKNEQKINICIENVIYVEEETFKVLSVIDGYVLRLLSIFVN